MNAQNNLKNDQANRTLMHWVLNALFHQDSYLTLVGRHWHSLHVDRAWNKNDLSNGLLKLRLLKHCLNPNWAQSPIANWWQDYWQGTTPVLGFMLMKPLAMRSLTIGLNNHSEKTTPPLNPWIVLVCQSVKEASCLINLWRFATNCIGQKSRNLGILMKPTDSQHIWNHNRVAFVDSKYVYIQVPKSHAQTALSNLLIQLINSYITGNSCSLSNTTPHRLKGANTMSPIDKSIQRHYSRGSL